MGLARRSDQVGPDLSNSPDPHAPRCAFGTTFVQLGSVWARSRGAGRSATREFLHGLRLLHAELRLSVGLKIRVSMVRFRPWPPLPPVYSGHMVYISFRTHG